MTSRNRRANTRTDSAPRLTIPVNEARDHIGGPKNATVTLVEYGDYQCPFCGEAYPVVKKIQKEYARDLRLAFRNFPLTEQHPRAEFGAEMAEASGAQNKFWEMHDFLYENQASLNDEIFFLEYAGARLGLDSSRIKDELARHVYFPRIREDFMSGVRSGVNGTPSFFINDFRHDGGYDFESLSAAIESQLKKKAKKRQDPR
jgi:protein-disulfide isomerase